MPDPAAALRARLRDPSPLLLPGVWDALSARLAARAGAEAVFVSGFAVSATLLGEPDFGIVTQTEMAAVARRVGRAVACPMIVDADTGYGSIVNVIRTVADLVAAGASGVFLEDQVWPKRCGHMRGKTVVPAADHVRRIRAAVRGRGGAECVIVARTDARQPLGLEDAITRALAYRDAGADALFVEAPASREELAEIARRLPPPLVANMVESGATPELGLDELGRLGFQIVVRPVSALFAATRALGDVYAALRRDGDTTTVRDRMVGFDEFNRLIGLEEKYALDAELDVEK